MTGATVRNISRKKASGKKLTEIFPSGKPPPIVIVVRHHRSHADMALPSAKNALPHKRLPVKTVAVRGTRVVSRHYGTANCHIIIYRAVYNVVRFSLVVNFSFVLADDTRDGGTCMASRCFTNRAYC